MTVASAGPATRPRRPADSARRWRADVTRRWNRLHRAGAGLVGDLTVYGLSAAFAGITATTSTLAPHRAWGTVATVGYGAAVLVVLSQLAFRRAAAIGPDVPVAGRGWLTGLTWTAVVAVPLLVQSAQRAGGRTDRAQEEVLVVEDGASRLLAHDTPYLSEQQITALPSDEQLLGYLPYQPGMVLFGMARALAGVAWWTDARVWFALATVVLGGTALVLLRAQVGVDGATLVRTVQLSAVLPISALTLSTGGNDLPVLALALLGLTLCATGRYGAAGFAVGAAAALKLFAWPILVVVALHAAAKGQRELVKVAAAGVGLPLLALVPVAAVDHAALAHNVVGFPLGAGVVDTPAASPLPGHLIADWLPGGRFVAGTLLILVGLAIAVRLRHQPPRTVAGAATICAAGLLVATMLLPATRFGYLLYPIALFSWVPVLYDAGSSDAGSSNAGSSNGGSSTGQPGAAAGERAVTGGGP
ncbi:glycosyltransferase 87 family protein [Solwaraspora sp. WMMA2101]|uniref:glycosyltransferase 87 family protein n=1 Tax=Solwaraspora sp. WMMA2101 TaxID=3404124 RepID=UPI003B929F46